MSCLQRKTPGGSRGRKNETQTDFSYPTTPADVKHSSPVLICGECSQFQDKPPAPRRHCEILGETVSKNDACHLDPLSDAYAWVDSLPVAVMP